MNKYRLKNMGLHPPYILYSLPRQAFISSLTLLARIPTRVDLLPFPGPYSLPVLSHTLPPTPFLSTPRPRL